MPSVTSNSKISFIVPMYNHVDHSKKMVSSFYSSIPKDLTYELILIDDFSIDETSVWLESLNLPNLIKIYNTQNLGYAKSNNKAANIASGEILALLNNDLILKSGWLEPMLKVFLAFPDSVGLVGNIQRRVLDNEIDHSGVDINALAKIDHVKLLPGNSKDPYKVFATTAACCLIKKNDFYAVGCFDEVFVNGGEDVDLCLKLRGYGKFNFVAPNSEVFHHVSLTRKSNDITNEINSKNLFVKWRKEFKNQVSKKWVTLLREENVVTNLLDFKFFPSFLNSIQTTSRFVAENFISREESRWAKIINNEDLNEKIIEKYTIHGLSFNSSLGHYLVDRDFNFILRDTSSIINFYICGRKIDINNNDSIAISISMNNIWYKCIPLDHSPNINAGVIFPLLIHNIANVFKIKVNFIDRKSNRLLEDASHLIYISHIVVDDKVLNKF